MLCWASQVPFPQHLANFSIVALSPRNTMILPSWVQTASAWLLASSGFSVQGRVKAVLENSWPLTKAAYLDKQSCYHDPGAKMHGTEVQAVLAWSTSTAMQGILRPAR